MKLAIIDTACANLASLKFALDRMGFESVITSEINELERADKLFLPGVGTAAKAMASLKEKNLVSFLQSTQKPLLGICLGMQILGRFSQELSQKTLGIMDFETLKFKEKRGFTLPHMGWNDVKIVAESEFKGEALNLNDKLGAQNKAQPNKESQNKEFKANNNNASALFKGLDGAYFYFVHSYCVPLNAFSLAKCEYSEVFSAALNYNNFYGVQFHPERSGEAGELLLRNFIKEI